MFSIEREVIYLTLLAVSFLLFPSFLVVIYGGWRYLSLCADVHIDAFLHLMFSSCFTGLHCV